MVERRESIVKNMSTAGDSSNNVHDICANCGKGAESINNLKACTGCKMVKYCNRECQIAHYPQHKKECREKRALIASEDNYTTCWICLDGGPDEKGKPLVRECSCRGGAGYVHTSCLISYAQHKTKKDYDYNSPPNIENFKHAMKFRRPWEMCPNCNQFYDEEGCLAEDLATAFVDFVEENYEDNIPHILEALLLKLETQSRKNNIDATLNIGNKMLRMINQLKEKSPSPGSRILVGIQPHVYNNMGIVYLKGGNDEEAVRCFQTYLDFSKGEEKAKQSVANAERNLALAKRKLANGQDVISSEKMLESLKTVYDASWRRGKDSTDTIRHGINYANELKNVLHTIEAERLLLELSAMSRRVHGPDHKETKKLTNSLQECQQRFVSVYSYYGPEQYLPLRYEGDVLWLALQYEGHSNQFLLVRGPIDEPEHKQVTFKTDDYLPALGTPVIIKGVQHPNTHLNGKVGEIKSWDNDSCCLTVNFEDKSLEQCSVHENNVHILFELPAKESSDNNSSSLETSSSSSDSNS